MPISSSSLKISAFKDISAFVFYEAQQRFNLMTKVHYVVDANEAHHHLINKVADIVFMSYDDTLSIVMQDNYSDIIGVLPVHSGILDLCGDIDLLSGKNKIGIDTETGYARALCYYLQHNYPRDYKQFELLYTGATNLRYDKLVQHEINATLLNPPFSYDNVKCIVRVFDLVGAYQGVVANVSKSWLNQNENRARLRDFIHIYSQTIEFIFANPEPVIIDLSKFYALSRPVAVAIYERLIENDGLNRSPQFNNAALLGTEKLFTWSTQVVVPENRSWITNLT